MNRRAEDFYARYEEEPESTIDGDGAVPNSGGEGNGDGPKFNSAGSGYGDGPGDGTGDWRAWRREQQSAYEDNKQEQE